MTLRLNAVYAMDCLDGLALMGENSVDSAVSDPPYGLAFMGKSWDSFQRINSGHSRVANEITAISRQPEKCVVDKTFQGFCLLWGRAVLRVLKPGAYLLAFGGTRTFHRLACALEDVGFEIRDQMQWIYGSGFPKSLVISKAIDKAAGVSPIGKRAMDGNGYMKLRNAGPNATKQALIMPNPTTSAARQWTGWGTALKPAHEPIIVARKPLSEGNVAANVLRWETGGLNIDGCRIGIDPRHNHSRHDGLHSTTPFLVERNCAGRWPANILLDEEAGRILDRQNGGGASRFFYCPKASRGERTNGGRVQNQHPTVKPLKLMEYLIRLVTPERGIVLDPFAGSGSTLLAALRLQRDFIGFEKDAEYVEIARRRLISYQSQRLSALVNARGAESRNGNVPRKEVCALTG